MAACIFCEIVAERLPASRVHEDDTHLAFLDIHPWRPGHTLVIPKRHAQRVHELDALERNGLLALGARIGRALCAAPVPCDDVHFVINDGPVAFQSVPHVHLHVLPRARGDAARLVAQPLRRLLIPVLGPAPRGLLDRQAAAVRAALEGG